jgi:hypothetical protein
MRNKKSVHFSTTSAQQRLLQGIQEETATISHQGTTQLIAARSHIRALMSKSPVA